MVSPVNPLGGSTFFLLDGQRYAGSVDVAARAPLKQIEGPVSRVAVTSLPEVSRPDGRTRQDGAGFERSSGGASESAVIIQLRRGGGADAVPSATERDAVLRRFRAYLADRAREFPEDRVESDARQALAALRADALFFNSLSPSERAIPEIAQALQFNQVVLPLRELSQPDETAPGRAQNSTASTIGTSSGGGSRDERSPLAKLAEKLLDELTIQGRAGRGTREGAEALERTAFRLLGLAAEDPQLAGKLSPESLTVVERKLLELEADRGGRRSDETAPVYSVLA